MTDRDGIVSARPVAVTRIVTVHGSGIEGDHISYRRDSRPAVGVAPAPAHAPIRIRPTCTRHELIVKIPALSQRGRTSTCGPRLLITQVNEPL